MGESGDEVDADRLTAFADLLARVEFATADELAAAVAHLGGAAQCDSRPGVAALVEAYADLLETERAARHAELEQGLARILTRPQDT